MTKRIAPVVALALVAAPILVVGCGGGSSGGTGGTNPITYDGAAGAGGTGGTKLDGAIVPVDSGAVDTSIAPDTAKPVDVAADVPMGGDTANLDVAAVDVAAIDTAAVIDTAPAIDTTPAVCTEAVKFSGGTITAHHTLTKACSPYTIKTDISVGGNAILTIEPGVTLNFQMDTELGVGYSTAGKLVANGTAANPIVFTSPTAGAGDWSGIKLWGNTMNGTSISYALIDYCGQSNRGCINGEGGIKAGRVSIDHVTIDHVGPGSNAIDENDTDSAFTISSCTFKDVPSTPTQQYAISVAAPSFAGIDSTNAFNGSLIELRGGLVSTTTTWTNPGTTVAVTSDLSIGGAGKPILTLAAGSTFKFASGTGIAIGYNNPGSIVAVGTATSGITFSSLAASPGAGDWDGITLWSNSNAKIAYATVAYAGSGTSSAHGAVSVVSDTDNLDIQNSKISYSGNYGIGIDCGSTAVLTNTNNTFTANTSGDVGPGPAGPTCL